LKHFKAIAGATTEEGLDAAWTRMFKDFDGLSRDQQHGCMFLLVRDAVVTASEYSNAALLTEEGMQTLLKQNSPVRKSSKLDS
jgi:hypothetical protein